jgi:hypothetical protein
MGFLSHREKWLLTLKASKLQMGKFEELGAYWRVAIGGYSGYNQTTKRGSPVMG